MYRGMYRIKGEIEGSAPLLFNRFTEESQADMESGKTGGKFTVEQRRQQALDCIYRNERGIYLPNWNFKCCLIEGARRGKVKEGKGSIAPLLLATMFVDGELVFSHAVEFLHEHWGRRPPRTGGACMVRRPGLEPGWKLPFCLVVIDDRRDASNIRLALEEAGLLVGLGSWRPEYGRFVVTKWEVEK